MCNAVLNGQPMLIFRHLFHKSGTKVRLFLRISIARISFLFLFRKLCVRYRNLSLSANGSAHFVHERVPIGVLLLDLVRVAVICYF